MIPRALFFGGTLMFLAGIVPAAPFVYVGTSDNEIAVIDGATDVVVATIPVGIAPVAVEVSRDGSRVYVGNMFSDNVAVIDALTRTIVATIPTARPVGLAVSPDDARLYVVSLDTDSICVVDTAVDQVIATIYLGNSEAPASVTTSPDGGRVYVFKNGAGVQSGVVEIDAATNTITGFVETGGLSSLVLVSPDGTRLYGPRALLDVISVIDAASLMVVDTISLPRPGRLGVISLDGSLIYLLEDGDAQFDAYVSVLDVASETVIDRVGLDHVTYGIGLTPDGSHIYLPGAQNVAVMDTAFNQIVDNIPFQPVTFATGRFIGLGPPVPSAEIPALGRSGMAALVLLLSYLAMRLLRRRIEPEA